VLSKDDLEGIVEPISLSWSRATSRRRTRRATQCAKLLYSAGVSIAAADGEVSPSEIKALTALLGADQVAARST